jgi:hypothetical protein
MASGRHAGAPIITLGPRKAAAFLFLVRDDFTVTLARFIASNRLPVPCQARLQCHVISRMVVLKGVQRVAVLAIQFPGRTAA